MVVTRYVYESSSKGGGVAACAYWMYWMYWMGGRQGVSMVWTMGDGRYGRYGRYGMVQVGRRPSPKMIKQVRVGVA